MDPPKLSLHRTPTIAADVADQSWMMGERVHFWGHFSLNRVNTFKESKLERASLQGYYQICDKILNF